MSQYANILKTSVSKAVKWNLTLEQTRELTNDIFDAVGYYSWEDYINSNERMLQVVKAVQDSLFGVTPEQTKDWIERVT